jgi:formate dehydrogenase
MVAQVEGGRITKLKPDRDNPHSRGYVCVKGTSSTGIVYNKDRITTPLKAVDKKGNFEPISWEEALDDIASRTKSIFEEHGSEAMGAYLGNPIFFSAFDFPAIVGFLQGLKSRKVFTPLSQDNLARTIGNEYVYGHRHGMALPDLDNCDFLIVFGSNMVVSNGSMMSTPGIRKQLKAIHDRGRVVMVDPRRTESAKRFEHISVEVGSDVWLLSAMVNLLFREGWHDPEFLNKEVAGWRSLRDAVAQITPEIASVHCGVPADDIVALTREFYQTRRAAIASRVGICRTRFATLSNILVDALNIIGGKFSQEGGTMLGHRVSGGKPPVTVDSKSRIGGLRTVGGFMMPSVVMAREISEPGPDQLRCLFVVAGNPLNSAPGGAELEAALKTLDLFVACDFFVNDTNRLADYILPTTTFLERANMPILTAKNMLAPTIQYAEPAIRPIGETRTEEWIFGQLMERVLDTPLPPMESVIDKNLQAGIYGDMSIDGNDGLSLDMLKRRPGGIALPEISREERWRKGIAHEDGKLHVWHADFEGEFARLAKVQPSTRFRLFGRRNVRSMNSWLHNVERLVRSQKPTLLVHPDDAKSEGIEDGKMVEVSNEYGRILVEAEISDEVRPGSVNYPHGWGHDGGWKRAVAAGGANVNLLSPTDPAAVEQISGASILDGIEVELRPVAT